MELSGIGNDKIELVFDVLPLTAINFMWSRHVPSGSGPASITQPGTYISLEGVMFR